MTTTLQPLDVPPVDYGDDIRHRSCRKQIRRGIAEWLRASGLTASGAAWEAAWIGAERDVTVLAELNRAEGLLPQRLEGTVSPAVLLPGDFLPDHGGHVVDVLADPETGAHWLTVQRVERRAVADEYHAAGSSVADVEIPAGGLVPVVRKPAKSR